LSERPPGQIRSLRVAATGRAASRVDEARIAATTTTPARAGFSVVEMISQTRDFGRAKRGPKDTNRL
jgi:hypothetical protein